MDYYSVTSNNEMLPFLEGWAAIGDHYGYKPNTQEKYCMISCISKMFHFTEVEKQVIVTRVEIGKNTKFKLESVKMFSCPIFYKWYTISFKSLKEKIWNVSTTNK